MLVVKTENHKIGKGKTACDLLSVLMAENSASHLPTANVESVRRGKETGQSNARGS